MKKFYIIITLLLGCNFSSFSQNVGINATAATPDPSAMLDVASPTTGVLVPRVALTDVTVAAPITSPANSLLVFNTATAGVSPNDVVPGYYFWDNINLKWQRLISGTFLNNTATSAIGKFYSTLSWGGTWNNGTSLIFTITDANMKCGTTPSAVFVSFDCTNANATMAGFTIRNTKCNAGNFVVTVTNNTGLNFSAGGIPITYVAFY